MRLSKSLETEIEDYLDSPLWGRGDSQDELLQAKDYIAKLLDEVKALRDDRQRANIVNKFVNDENDRLLKNLQEHVNSIFLTVKR